MGRNGNENSPERESALELLDLNRACIRQILSAAVLNGNLDAAQKLIGAYGPYLHALKILIEDTWSVDTEAD